MDLTFATFIDQIITFINNLIILIFALAFIVMMWKIVDVWIINAANDTKRSEGQAVALTAAVVMAVMASIWGILTFLQQALF